MKIAAAFVAAKRAFAPALKTNTNSHFKNKYVDLASCLEAVNEALLDNGIAVYQETFEVPDGACVETCFLHESGETLRMGKLHVPAAKHDPQGYGSALTYARRYSLMAACGIAAEDDDGNAASQPRKKFEPQPKPVNPLDAVVQKVTAESAESVAEPSPKQIEYQDESGGSWALRLPNRAEPMSISFNQESWLNEFNTMADSVMKSGKLPPAQRIEKLKQLRQANEAEVSRLVMMDKAKFLQTYSQRIGALDALAKAAAQ
jgi:hypothetical protein